MESLKKVFEKIHSKYDSKRNFFKKVIERLLNQGRLDFHKKAFTLLQEADLLSKELKDSFVITVDGQLDESLLKQKLKSFKKLYKQLNEMTKPIWRQWIEAIVVAGVLVFVLRTYIFGLYHVPTGSAEPTILVGDRIWGNKMAYYFEDIKRGDSVIFDNPEFIYNRSSLLSYFWQKYVGLPVPLLGLDIGPDNWVKRVIAVPGDIVEGRVENGKTVIYLNRKKLNETNYINPYPLIKLNKTTGFLGTGFFGSFRIPSFIRKQTKIVDYTYDPDNSFEDQPFYYMKPEQVVRKINGKPIIKNPYSPSYEYLDMLSGLGRSVDSFGPIKVPKGKYWVMGDSRKNSKDSRFWGFLDEKLIHGRASFIIYSVDSEEPFWLFELIKHPIVFWKHSMRWNRFLKWIK